MGENVRIQRKNIPLEQCIPKITGFGCSTVYPPEGRIRTVVGDTCYRAPEVYSEDYDFLCDNWSLGAMMYVLMCGYPPYCAETDKETARLVKGGGLTFPDEDFKSASKESIDILKALLHGDPSKRLHMRDALTHPWMKAASPKVMRQCVKHSHAQLNTFSQQNALKKAARRAVARKLSVEDMTSCVGSSSCSTPTLTTRSRCTS